MQDEPHQTWSLPTQHVGQCVCVFDQLDSTNSYALALGPSPNVAGNVFLARSQSAGRGQYGRTWQAPPDSSVLMSVLLFPPPALRRPAMLTGWAAVSVCETILQVANIRAHIKWPNDVLVDGKKICGILIEQRTTNHPDFPLATVVGIGLNVTQTESMFAEAGLPGATSLRIIGAKECAFESVAKALIGRLDDAWHLLANGEFAPLESQWKQRFGLLGEKVIAESAARTYQGRLLNMTFAGLDLELEHGEIVRLQPETIRRFQLQSDSFIAQKTAGNLSVE